MNNTFHYGDVVYTKEKNEDVDDIYNFFNKTFVIISNDCFNERSNCFTVVELIKDTCPSENNICIRYMNSNFEVAFGTVLCKNVFTIPDYVIEDKIGKISNKNFSLITEKIKTSLHNEQSIGNILDGDIFILQDKKQKDTLKYIQVLKNRPLCCVSSNNDTITVIPLSTKINKQPFVHVLIDEPNVKYKSIALCEQVQTFQVSSGEMRKLTNISKMLLNTIKETFAGKQMANF